MQNLDRAFQALKAADAAGNVEDATKLANYIREMQAEQQAEPEGDPLYDPEYDPAKGRQPLNVGFGDYTMELGSLPEGAANTLAGLGHGVNKVKEGVTDLAYRAGSFLGVDGADDALARTSKRLEVDKQAYEHLKDSSGYAQAASIVGEVVTAGAGGYGIASKAMQGGLSAWKAATLEGMVVEGATTRGDFGDRTQSAVVGGITGGVAQKALGGLGSLYDNQTRRVDADGLTAIADATLESANANVTAAREDGGFTLDMADAAPSATALMERSRLANGGDEGFDLRNAMANQELDITARAQSFIDGTGGNHLEINEVGEGMRDVLVGIRNADEETYKALYRQLDESTGGQVLDTTGLEAQLPKILEDFKISSGPTVGKIKRVLEKYGVLQKLDESDVGSVGILGPDGLPVSTVSTGSPTVVAPEKPLTASNYEIMIGEINDMYQVGGAGGINRAVGQTKKALDDWIDDALLNQGADASLVNIGKQARDARVAFRNKWEQKDILDKMTSKGKGTNEWRANPSQAISHFMNPRNVSQLKKLRSRLNLGNDADRMVLANLQQVPLLKAFAKATKNTTNIVEGGVPNFNNNAFRDEWSKVSQESKTSLYGPELTKEIDSAVRAWGLRGKIARVASDDQTSGSARAIMGILVRMIVPSGRTGSATIAGLPILRDIGQSFQTARNVRAVDALTSGRMTEAQIDARAQRLQQEIMEHYRGTDMLNYDTVIATLSRAWAREETTSQLED